MGPAIGDGAIVGVNRPGVWDLILALAVVDLVCYFLHKHEVSDYLAQQCTCSLARGSVEGHA